MDGSFVGGWTDEWMDLGMERETGYEYIYIYKVQEMLGKSTASIYIDHLIF